MNERGHMVDEDEWILKDRPEYRAYTNQINHSSWKTVSPTWKAHEKGR
jgi:hypothetical protein